MVLSTGRVLEIGTGSMTRRSHVLDQIELEAVAFCRRRTCGG
jgi:hypothetical protein